MHFLLIDLKESRKGSREKNQYLENDLEWCKMIRDEEGKLLKRSITSDTMSSSKGSSDSEKLFVDKTSRKNSGCSDKGEDVRKSSRQKEHKPKASYCGKNKYEYRRKSLAVVERPRVWDHSKRRSSVSNSQMRRVKDTQKTTLTTASTMAEIKKEKERDGGELDDSILEKLERGRTDNRYSRDFETSCWGLQNLRKRTTVFQQNPVISNSAVNNSLKKSIASEKSKSEDNLAITTSEKLETSILSNNLNISKTEESIEKQLTAGLEKKKKLDSTGHLSFLSRLKQLKDRMSFGRDLDGNSEMRNLPKETNFREKTGKSISDNQNPSKECEDDFEKSRTLPKTKKPHRTSKKMRKGWRALIGKSEGNSSSSLDISPSPGSPSPIRFDPRRKSSAEEVKTRGKLSDSCAGERKKANWLSSPKKSGFLGKLNRSEEENCGRHTFLNNLTSSFRKRGSKNDEENGASSSSSMQEGSKPN